MTVAIRTAVIGFGLSARVFHLPFVLASERYELCAIASSRRDEVLAAHPGIECFADPAELIRRADAELVIITAPNQAHHGLARLALEHDRHVLLEKPVVVQAHDGHDLIRLAGERRRVLAPFHNRRWDGDFLTVQGLIESGRLGEIKLFESHFDRFRPTPQRRWRENAEPGSGILYDLGPHLIDQALALFGKPTALSARVLKTRPGAEAVDYFHLQLHYPNTEVILHSDPFGAGPNPRFRVRGSRSSYLKTGLDPQEARLRAGVRPDSDDWAAETPEQYGVLYHGEGQESIPTVTGGYQRLFENLADAIRHGAPLAVQPGEALGSIELIELALRVQATGRTLPVAP